MLKLIAFGLLIWSCVAFEVQRVENYGTTAGYEYLGIETAIAIPNDFKEKTVILTFPKVKSFIFDSKQIFNFICSHRTIQRRMKNI